MAARFESFGLTELVEKPEDAFRLASLTMTEGQRVRGYRGDYFRLYVGDAVVIVRTMRDLETGEDQLLGMDTHAVSDCVWTCRVERDVTAPDADPMSRQLLVRGESGADRAVVSLLCADVLPAIHEGDQLRMNVAGFPLRVSYDLEEGATVMEAQQDTVLLQGIVKDAKVGETYLGMEPLTKFLSVTASTPLGELELCHPFDLVAESQRDNVKPGAVVSALCTLSGDVAVGEYAGGVAYSEEQDLILLREAFLTEDASRLLGAMHSECVCLLQHRGVAAQGAGSAAAALQEMMEAAGSAGLAVDPGRITGVEQTGEDPPPYVPGKRCLLLGDPAYPGYYALLCLIDTDSVGRIRRLTVTNDQRYDFEQELGA